MSVSLCMIVKDEEATLADCLESVRDVVTEIIVVDTGSTDRTAAIAQEAGAKVYNFDWQGDFAAARNESLKYAQGDWILVVDADELLLPTAIPAMRKVMQDDHCLVINLVRQELATNQVPYSLVSRLFRRHPALRFDRPYHESIDDSVMALVATEPHWKIVELAGITIRHSGYTPAAIAKRNKLERARTTMENYLQTHPTDPYTCNKLGALYLEIGDTAQGRELLQRGLQAAAIEPNVRYELHYHLAGSYSQAEEYDVADKHFQAAVEQPISPYLKLGAYNNWGDMRMRQNNPMAAIVLFQKVVNVSPNLALGFFNLATAFKGAGNLEGAIACYEQAIALDPTNAAAHQGLGASLMKGGQILPSLDAFRRAIALYEQQGSPEADRLRQVLQEMNLA